MDERAVENFGERGGATNPQDQAPEGNTGMLDRGAHSHRRGAPGVDGRSWSRPTSVVTVDSRTKSSGLRIWGSVEGTLAPGT